jgi:shikimate dehydrogenase
MKLYGLIGRRLGHSFSPDYFRKKFHKLGIEADYRLFEMENVDGLREFVMEHPELRGLNITVPFKQQVLKLVDEIHPLVRKTGAANTIKVIWEGKHTILFAYNTDVAGFENTLMPFLGDEKVERALVMGTGGSAKAVGYVLEKNNISFYSVSRNPENGDEIAYTDLDEKLIENSRLLINTTPLGMYPDSGSYPDIPFHMLTPRHYVYDLVYNPEETEFLRKARSQGAAVKGGLEMLYAQAEESWKIWQASGS